MTAKKKACALLLLSALALTLTGCGEPPLAKLPQGPPPTILEAMHLSPEQIAQVEADPALAGMVEELNLTDTQEGTTLRVLSTCGDGTKLYILYSVTLPKSLGRHPSNKKLYALMRNRLEPCDPCRSYGTNMVSYEPNSRALYFLADISYPTPGYQGQTLSFQLMDEGVLTPSGACFSLSWTPQNHAPQRSVQAQGGSCLVTPLRMDLTLPYTLKDLEERFGASPKGALPGDPFAPATDSLKVIFRDGTVWDDPGGGWEADPDPISAVDLLPLEGLYPLEELETVKILDLSFNFTQAEQP